MLLYEIENILNEMDIVEIWDGEKHISFKKLGNDYKHTHYIKSIRPSRLESALIIECELIDIVSMYPKLFINDEFNVINYLNYKYGIKGKSIARWKGAGMGDYYCSLCQETLSGNNFRYCPNCGAKMEREC